MGELDAPGRSAAVATAVEEVSTRGRPVAASEGPASSSDASSWKPRSSSKNFPTTFSWQSLKPVAQLCNPRGRVNWVSKNFKLNLGLMKNV